MVYQTPHKATTISEFYSARSVDHVKTQMRRLSCDVTSPPTAGFSGLLLLYIAKEKQLSSPFYDKTHQQNSCKLVQRLVQTQSQPLAILFINQ